jgi:hypothetical protein
MINPWKLMADWLVWYSVFECVGHSLTAIFSGQVYGPGAFVAGAIMISAALFGEFYFREV